MFQHILFPTDGSEHSEKALHFVKDFAPKYDATVTILYVYELVGTSLLGLDEHMGDYLIELEKIVKTRSQKILNHNQVLLEDYQIKTHSQMLKGNPKSEIIRLADEKLFDVIIMGSRGMGMLKGLLLGSVSNYVVHHAKCPVLLIR